MFGVVATHTEDSPYGKDIGSTPDRDRGTGSGGKYVGHQASSIDKPACMVAGMDHYVWNLQAPLGSTQIMGLIVALGAGLLIGVERERRKGEGPSRDAAGLRTFTIIALLGATGALFGSPLLVAVGAAAVGLLALAAYLRSSESDPGLTTEVAMVITYLVGALAMTAPQLAAGLGVLVALLLAARGPLHDLVRNRLTDREVLDALLLCGAALVVLPLMPDRAVDSLGILNPRVIWRLTVIVLAINAFGYVAQRALGARLGLPMAGFFGGFISSSATIAAMGTRASERPASAGSCVAAAALSNIATVVQLVAVLSLVSVTLLQRLLPAFVAMGTVAVGFGAWSAYRAVKRSAASSDEIGGRAFQPRQALVFSVTVTALLYGAALLQNAYGASGALIGIALGGFADAHSAAASAGALVAREAVTMPVGVWAVLLAVTTNTCTKLIVAAVTGGRSFLLALAPALIAMVAALWVAALL